MKENFYEHHRNFDTGTAEQRCRHGSAHRACPAEQGSHRHGAAYVTVEGLTKQVQMLKADSRGDLMVEVVDRAGSDPGHPCYVCLGQPLLTQEL